MHARTHRHTHTHTRACAHVHARACTYALTQHGLLVRSPHEQQSREIDKEDELDPLGHFVRGGRSITPVDDNDRHQDRQNIHDEREQEVFGDQGNHLDERERYWVMYGDWR